MSLAYSPDGKTLATGSMSSTITIWDMTTGEERANLGDGEPDGDKGPNVSLAYSPDGETLAAVSYEDIKLWDVKTRKKRATLKHPRRVGSPAYSLDGETLVTACGDQTVRLWDTRTNRERATLRMDDDSSYELVFSPDGVTLALGGKPVGTVSKDRTVRLLDLKTGHVRTTITGHNKWVSCVAFSPDGRTLATGSGDKTINLWDVATNKERLTLPR
jgi:WD40 repeat protein